MEGLDSSNSEIAPAESNPVTFMNRDSVQGLLSIDSANQLDSQLRLVVAGAAYHHSNLKICSQGKGDFVPLIMQWSADGEFKTIVDGLPVHETSIGTIDWNGEDLDPFDARDPSASTDSNALRDVALLTTAHNTGASRISIGLLGDSLMNFGGFPDWAWADEPTKAPEWIPITNSFMTAGPKGIDGADGAAVESVNGKHYDAGCLTTIIREMYKRGYASSNNLNFTQGGATTQVIKTNATNMLTIGTPDIVFMNAGQNDANDGASFDAAAAVTYKSNLREILSILKNGGVKQVIMAELHSMQNNATLYSDDVYRRNVDTCNKIINDLPRWAGQNGLGTDFVRIAPVFKAFGGRYFDSSLFITDDVHHNTAGSWLFGKTLVDVLDQTPRSKGITVAIDRTSNAPTKKNKQKRKDTKLKIPRPLSSKYDYME